MTCPCWAPAKYGHDDASCDVRKDIDREADEAVAAAEELLRLPEDTCE